MGRAICVDSLEPRALFAAASFAVLGDFGDAGPAEEAVAHLVQSWNPDFVITTGDNNYPDGDVATIDANIGQYYHSFIGDYKGTFGEGSPANRFFPTLGNHDWETDGARPYLDYFTLPGNERYYDFVRGPVHFFMIDSDPREPDGIISTSTQAMWLQAGLAASTSPWQIVVPHHAPFSSSDRHGSTPELQWPYKQWGADAVFSGHDHLYERIIHDDIPYFVNGLGGRENIYNFNTPPVDGSAVRFNGDHGAMRVNATDTSMTFEFITREGELIDTYTLEKPQPPPPPPPLPTIRVTRADRGAVENPIDTARFKVSRTGSTEANIKIRYSLGGGATNGLDYELLTGWVTIKAGRDSANVYVTPIDDGDSELTEAVRLRLADKSHYTVASDGREATVHIFDDDTPKPAAWRAGVPFYEPPVFSSHSTTFDELFNSDDDYKRKARP